MRGTELRSPDPIASCSCDTRAHAMDVVRRLEAAERFLESQAAILDATAFQD